MSRIDDLLDAEGARWRAEVDARRSPRPSVARARRVSPRNLAWSSGLIAGAAAVVAVALAVPWSTGGDSSAGSSGAGGAAMAHRSSVHAASAANGVLASAAPSAHRDESCAGETLATTSVGPVRAGGAIRLHGARYDLVACPGASSPGTSQPERPRVVLRLTTADHRTTVVASETPHRAGGSFTALVVVPASAPAGPAVISDGRGHVVRFVVTR